MKLASVCTTIIRPNHFVGITSLHFGLSKSTQVELYHLGVKQYVDYTTFSRANEKRDCRIFGDFGDYLIGLFHPLYADFPVPNVDIDNETFALDPTTISLSINLFTWAEGKYSRGAVKVHSLSIFDF